MSKVDTRKCDVCGVKADNPVWALLQEIDGRAREVCDVCIAHLFQREAR